MRILLIFIIVLALLVSVTPSYSQEALHTWELIMHTKNSPDTITFNITSTSPKVWKSHRSYEHSTYLTTLTKYVNPDDITMPGNDNSNNHGWDSDAYPDKDHVLGRGYYEITVSGKYATLDVDCFGTDSQDDVVVLYDYSLDVFKVDGNVVTEVNLYDDPTGLQPTPPRNFRCTNAGQVGYHPNFAWDTPSQPAGVPFKYKIYRSENGGPFWCVMTELTIRSWIDQEVCIAPKNQGVRYLYYVIAYTNQSPDSDPSN